MRRLTTLAMVLVLLGGAAGCGGSKPGAATEEREARSKAEQEHPELRPNSTYFAERGKAEERRHEEGIPANLKIAEHEGAAAQAVEKAGEGKEPAHAASWYEEKQLEIRKEEGESQLKAACREKYGAEAKTSAVVQPILEAASAREAVRALSEHEEPHATCTSSSGETWRVAPLYGDEYGPRLYQ